jgi:glutathione S-transferase
MRSPDLILYHAPGCPYCIRVDRVLDELGLEIEHRDVRSQPRHREDLHAARGRTTVPVLRILDVDGSADERWMPESLDIIRYLRERFGAG